MNLLDTDLMNDTVYNAQYSSLDQNLMKCDLLTVIPITILLLIYVCIIYFSLLVNIDIR